MLLKPEKLFRAGEARKSASVDTVSTHTQKKPKALTPCQPKPRTGKRSKASGPLAEIVMPTVEKFKVSELEGADYNPRLISPEALQGLRESLEEFSTLEVPVINVFGGKKRIVSGHQRITVFKANGVEYADCIKVCFDETKEKIANLTMNNRAIQGTWDVSRAAPALKLILADLPTCNLAGFKALEAEVNLELEKVNQADSRKAREKFAEDTKPKIMNSVAGKIYKLGKHRLWCGDMAVGIGKLLGNKKAAACITDPPYNVDYGDYSGVGIQNDKMTNDDWTAFVGKFCQLMLKYTDGPCYVFMSLKELPALSLAWEANGGIIHRWLFWAKDKFVVGHADYHYQHEPILFGYRSGLTPDIPETARTNIFEHPKLQGKHELHVTQKPLDIVRAMILDSTKKDEIVLDPFAGSGTTLVLCEETSRICLSCEVDTYYADVIRKRWAQQVHGDKCDWVKLTPAVD